MYEWEVIVSHSTGAKNLYFVSLDLDITDIRYSWLWPYISLVPSLPDLFQCKHGSGLGMRLGPMRNESELLQRTAWIEVYTYIIYCIPVNAKEGYP